MVEEKKEVQKTPEQRMEELNRQLRGYMANIEALRAEISVINQSIADLRTAEATLRSLKELGKGKEVLIPVGATAQIKAKSEGVDEVIMSIGTGISAVMSYDEAVDRIRKEIAALEALRRALEEAIADLYNKIEELLEEVRKVGQEEAKQ